MVNVEYMVKYFEENNPKGVVKDLFMTIFNECTNPKHIEGYPKWKRGKQIKALDLPLVPGMQPGVTWCIFVAYYVIKKMGYDTRPFTDKEFSENTAIGYTTGNEMAREAFKAADAGTIKETYPKEAVWLANQGIPVLVAATGKNGAGHVGIVAPNKEGKLIVGQAGIHNGFFELDKAFPSKYVNKPRFFVPNKKE